jgi:hypothetical protein
MKMYDVIIHLVDGKHYRGYLPEDKLETLKASVGSNWGKTALPLSNDSVAYIANRNIVSVDTMFKVEI